MTFAVYFRNTDLTNAKSKNKLIIMKALAIKSVKEGQTFKSSAVADLRSDLVFLITVKRISGELLHLIN
jgi:hypothetical protein